MLIADRREICQKTIELSSWRDGCHWPSWWTRGRRYHSRSARVVHKANRPECLVTKKKRMYKCSSSEPLFWKKKKESWGYWGLDSDYLYLGATDKSSRDYGFNKPCIRCIYEHSWKVWLCIDSWKKIHMSACSCKNYAPVTNMVVMLLECHLTEFSMCIWERTKLPHHISQRFITFFPFPRIDNHNRTNLPEW